MKYYKLKKQVWVSRFDNHTIISDHETDKAYGFIADIVSYYIGKYRFIYIPKSICKVEDTETDTKQVDHYGDVEYVHNILHEVALYIPKWFFGVNRTRITISSLIDHNHFYSCEEVEL